MLNGLREILFIAMLIFVLGGATAGVYAHWESERTNISNETIERRAATSELLGKLAAGSLLQRRNAQMQSLVEDYQKNVAITAGNSLSSQMLDGWANQAGLAQPVFKRVPSNDEERIGAKAFIFQTSGEFVSIYQFVELLEAQSRFYRLTKLALHRGTGKLVTAEMTVNDFTETSRGAGS